MTSFCSRSTLHKYIKAECNTPKGTSLVKKDSESSSTWLILYFKAKLFILGSGPTFRKWNYATPSIFFNLRILPAICNSKCSVYLNTRYGVNLVVKTWLMKKLKLDCGVSELSGCCHSTYVAFPIL